MLATSSGVPPRRNGIFLAHSVFTSSEIVQGDKTGDTPLSETVKQYLKDKYQKPGNVFIGVTHRLDRPVSGLVNYYNMIVFVYDGHTEYYIFIPPST